jgi:hypothetical protein
MTDDKQTEHEEAAAHALATNILEQFVGIDVSPVIAAAAFGNAIGNVYILFNLPARHRQNIREMFENCIGKSLAAAQAHMDAVDRGQPPVLHS